MIEFRFHGRGGQGVKLASRILGSSGFLAGFYAQDFALFGAERRGAPVLSFTRLSTTPIDRRGYIESPDLAVVLDDSLLHEGPGEVFQGVEAKTPVIVNTATNGHHIATEQLPPANFVFLDLSALSRQTTGRTLVSAVAASVAVKSVAAISLETLIKAVAVELAALDLPRDLVEQNQLAAREAYIMAPAVSLNSARIPAQSSAIESLPPLAPPRFAGATIRHRASSVLRATASWRMERPEIELAKCKRCFLCYLYCPEAAMGLDQQNYPHIDYDHCKGCLICYEECPTDAITRQLEV
ncbi:MAG TPA: 2-oxoacid:acceptor oxidoreductase family protein [Terriglobales bacterium]|nr:2-oxoacid:acceptor oxidoreductase family protein [Terriglobales bacterium]